MLRERAAAFFAEPGQHVEHAGGQKLLANRGHHQDAERRLLGRLQHQRVTRAERGRDLQCGQQHRCVPRNDRADDAQRLAPRIAQHLFAQRDCLSLQLAGKATEIAEDVGGKPRLAAGLRAQSVAGFKCDHTRNPFGFSLHLVGDADDRVGDQVLGNFRGHAVDKVNDPRRHAGVCEATDQFGG